MSILRCLSRIASTDLIPSNKNCGIAPYDIAMVTLTKNMEVAVVFVSLVGAFPVYKKDT
jgi:hypothetical protein